MGKIDRQAAEIAKFHTTRSRKGRPAKAPPVSVPAPPWDHGAQGQANQVNMRTEPATDYNPETGRQTPNPNGVKRRRRKTWVEAYHAQGKLTHKQAAAAEKLRNAAEGLRERDPLAALGEVRGSGSDMMAARVDSRRYFHDLWSKIPPGYKPIIERVVIDDMPIWHGNMAQRERHMQRLANGLDTIA